MARKRSTKKQPEAKSRAVDTTRGSKLWAFNHFRSPMLTSLLNDLVDREREGLPDKHCRMVRVSLEYFTNYATEFNRGGFLTGPIYREIDRFTSLYRQWNDIEGSSEDARADRRKLLGKLRKQRQKITDHARQLQFELENELDQKLLADTYRAIGELITLGPDIFKNLAYAYAEYLKRGGVAGG